MLFKRLSGVLLPILLLTAIAAFGEPVFLVDTGSIFLQSQTITPESRTKSQRAPDGSTSVLDARIENQLQELGLDKDDPAYYIVRVEEKEISSLRKQIEEAGASVISYVRFFAFVVKMDGSVLNQIKATPGIEWIGLYTAEHRISKPLLAKLPVDQTDDETENVEQTERAQADTDPGEPLLTVDIVLFPESNLDATGEFIQEHGGTIETMDETPRSPKLRVTAPISLVKSLLLAPNVRWIEEFVPPVMNNDISAIIMGVPEVWNTHGLTGKGQIIGHADSGLDTGSIDDIHPDFRGRIRAAFALVRTNDWSDLDGHGTHTAGSILGDGTMSGGRYKGIAYEAELVHQSIGIAPNVLHPYLVYLSMDLFEQAYTNNASVFSYSIGAPYNNQYALDSFILDHWTWNDGAPKNMLMVVAAGNEGPSGVTSPGTAKNALTIGASQNFRPILDPSHEAFNPYLIAIRSARGPTEDGRIKPDLVAPGTAIISTRPRSIPTTTDLMAGGVQGWLAEDAHGPTSTPWEHGTANADQSPSWSYRNQGTFEHYLVSRPVTIPDENTDLDDSRIYVRLRWKGKLDQNAQLAIAYRQIDGDWKYLETPATYHQPRDASEWIQEYWPIPANLAGQTVEIGIEAYGDTEHASADIRVEACEIILMSWGNLPDYGLAHLGDDVHLHYALAGGTSMATPLVAGAAALVRQFYQGKGKSDPSAELLKANLINGAYNLTPSTPRPDNNQGWGLIDLDYSLFPPGDLYSWDVKDGLPLNTVHSYPLEVDDGATELRATLVWADMPPDPGMPGLVNDLDLHLVSPDESIIRRLDNINNVEGLDVVSPQSGQWQVLVTRTAYSEFDGPQPYALVVSIAYEPRIDPAPPPDDTRPRGRSSSGTTSEPSRRRNGSTSRLDRSDFDTGTQPGRSVLTLAGKASEDSVDLPPPEKDSPPPPSIKAPTPTQAPLEPEIPDTRDRRFYLGSGLGVDSLAGASIEVEMQLSNWALSVGHIRNGSNSENHGYRAALRYYLKETESTWYAELAGATWSRPHRDKESISLGAGYRWMWTSGFNLRIGGSVARMRKTVQHSSAADETELSWEPMINASVGYIF